MDSIQQLAHINQGRLAVHAMEFVGDIFTEEERVIITKFKQMFRTGDYSQEKLLACAASLCTLDDIRAKLIRLSKKGERVSGELNG